MSEKVVPFLPAALEQEVRSILNDAAIYNIDSYGWLNENDPDPEFIGHAMWQTDQPSIDLNAFMGEQPVRERPEEVEKLILTTGEDFCGLMQASRLSIGLALLWHDQARRNLWNENPFFWLHHMDAILKLAIASDRLRELLIISCTGASLRSYKNKAKGNRLYVTPFKEAEQLLGDRGLHDSRLSEPLAALPKLSDSIFTYINRRNTIVHELATRMASIMRESVSHLQKRFDQEQEQGFSPPSDDFAKSLAASDAHAVELQTEIDRAKHELRDWYTLLIQASNFVFQVEYWSRVLSRK